ncbi:MAG: hypothetical protein KatS3mg035_1085 [Bacteroidia bacterium]|nr:MAG: hypothetical protein KatS3mg035_1085 [Bacteroidia bacterium]
MPFIQGDSSSIPEMFKPYSKIIEENFIEKGEIGFLTIDESFVEAGKSQRGYNSAGINRTVTLKSVDSIMLTAGEVAEEMDGEENIPQSLKMIQWFSLQTVSLIPAGYGM